MTGKEMFNLFTRHRLTVLAHLRRMKLKENWLHALFVIECDPSCVGEVGKQIGLMPSAMSRVVDSLVKKGMADLYIDPADRRRMLLSITEVGVTTVQDYRKQITAELERVA